MASGQLEFDTLLRSLQIEIYLLDDDGNVLARDGATATIVGKPFGQLIPADDRPAWYSSWRAIHTELEESCFEFADVDQRGPRTKRARLFRGDSVPFVVIVEDITREKEIAASLQRYETIFDRAAWGIAVAVGDNATLDFVNPLFAEMHGYSVEQLAGTAIDKIFPPEHRQEIDSHRLQVHESGHASFETWHLRRDGSKFPVRVNASTVVDPQGRVQFRAALVQDISSEHQAAEELRFTNMILKTQQELSPDGILVVDDRGSVISYNARFVEMWRIPAVIIAGGRDHDALQYVLDTVEDPAEFEKRVKHLYAHPEKTSFETIRLRDGRIFDRHSAAMAGANGRRYGRVWFFRDVTEQRRSEHAIRESEERLARVIESAMDAIVVIDEQRRIRVFNAAAEAIFGASSSDVSGQPIDRFLSASFRDLLQDCLDAFSRRGTQNRYMWLPTGLRAVRSDGDEFAVEATISAVESQSQRLLTIILRDVNERVCAANEIRSLQRENVLLKESLAARSEFAEIIGTSAGIRRVIGAIRQVAPTEASVLITGETGTGKGLIAQAIHRASPHAEKVFVTVNCAALPETLIESELFGHEQGAFTGAMTRKIGRFEAADGGTIFLDEIGDLPLPLQGKLLRVLQDGEFERIGGIETLHVKVRVVAATNRDLQSLIATGQFRADLFYRLNVFPIEVPPLRERLSDIEPLARAFIQRYATRMGKAITAIPPNVLEALRAYAWPGNIRELQNILERAVILTQDGQLLLDQGLPSVSAPAAPDETLALLDMEREHILKVLRLTGGRVSGARGAAKLLDIKPTTLESRMKKLGIERANL
ncbi:MAG: sigma 54-interacting transcriptional regulator [Phycisphaerae bacterium]